MGGVQPNLNLGLELGVADKLLVERKRAEGFERFKQDALQKKVPHPAKSEDSVEDINITANCNLVFGGGNNTGVAGGQNQILLSEKNSSLLGERNMDRENRRVMVKKDHFIERGRDREGVPSGGDNTDGAIVSKEAGGRYYSDMKLQKENNDPLISGVTTAVTLAQRNLNMASENSIISKEPLVSAGDNSNKRLTVNLKLKEKGPELGAGDGNDRQSSNRNSFVHGKPQISNAGPPAPMCTYGQSQQANPQPPAREL